MHSEESVHAANIVLRSIATADVNLRRTVLGPEPSIGVIVPTYNDSKYLSDALRSVQEQTYTKWRCYVIDDASPEDVKTILDRFREDERFILLRHATNSGLAAARNTGIRHVSESILQFLDADDMLTPWAFESRVDVLRSRWNDPVVAGVHGQILQCPEETAISDVSTWADQQLTKDVDWLASDGESPFVVHAPLVRTEIVKKLGGFNESFENGAEDWEFWRRILRHGYLFPGTRSVVGGYRQRRASMIREHSQVHLARASELLDEAEQWVAVDDLMAVSNARMPIGEGRDALRRLIRAARWAGIRAAQTGNIEDAVTDDIRSLLIPNATVGTRREECLRSARAGIIRGLGLSVRVVDQLDSDTSKIIYDLAGRITDVLLQECSIYNDFPVPTVNLSGSNEPYDVLLLGETVADVRTLAILAKRLNKEGKAVGFVDLDIVNGESGARSELAAEGFEPISYNAVAFGRVAGRIFVGVAPLAPGTLDLVKASSSRGSQFYFLQEDDQLIVDCIDPTLHEADYLTADEILSCAESIGLRNKSREDVGAPAFDDPTPFSSTARLPFEEDSLDARSHEWFMDMRESCVGQTAIIIGNGPSLNLIDLNLLAYADTFGVNSIFLAAERLPEPLTYYVVEDTAVFDDNESAIKSFEAENKLFPTLYLERFADREITRNTHFFRMNSGFYGRTTPWGPTGTYCLPRFSTNAAQRVFSGQSVSIINLQLAYWFGYERILLVGMDFSYTIPPDAEVVGNRIVSRSQDPNHFHPDYFGPGKTWKDPKLDRVLINYRLTHKMYQMAGRQIINCTVGGELHEFPRSTLEVELNNDHQTYTANAD